MDAIWTSIVSILTAIIGVAILSVIVSRNSNTVGVIRAGAGAFTDSLGVALSPVTRGSGYADFNGNFNLN